METLGILLLVWLVPMIFNAIVVRETGLDIEDVYEIWFAFNILPFLNIIVLIITVSILFIRVCEDIIEAIDTDIFSIWYDSLKNWILNKDVKNSNL